MRIIKSAVAMTAIALLASIQPGDAQINADFNTIGGIASSVAGGEGQVNNGNYSTIGGGTGNNILAGVTESFIGGGIDNTIDAGGDWSIIGGGFNNYINAIFGTIGSANQSQIHSPYGTIGGGAVNVISTDSIFSTIGGGAFNSITKSNATIAGGISNIVAGKYSSIPGGRLAKTTKTGQFALANGSFASPGDAQMSMYVLKGTTTSETPAELFLDGVGERLGLPNNSTWLCDIQIIGRGPTTTQGFKAVGQRHQVIVENNGGTMSLDYVYWLGHVSNFPFDVVEGADLASRNPNLLGIAIGTNGTQDALTITVTGKASQTVHWVAVVRTVELTTP